MKYVIGDRLTCHTDTSLYNLHQKFIVGDIVYIRDKFKDDNITFITICTERKWNFDTTGNLQTTMCGSQTTYKSTEVSNYFTIDEIRHKKESRKRKLDSL